MDSSTDCTDENELVACGVGTAHQIRPFLSLRGAKAVARSESDEANPETASLTLAAGSAISALGIASEKTLAMTCACFFYHEEPDAALGATKFEFLIADFGFRNSFKCVLCTFAMNYYDLFFVF
ncbi:MAG: hypothetical protein QY305_09330 [Candidatus Brocadiaceae baterium WH-1]|nr:MAG: hypothetical protein QY305_09330 [Candidatus Jettenia sp. AMX2]